MQEGKTKIWDIIIINIMLTKIDKSKILRLRSENFSYKAIREELGYAIDTIMDVCNEEKERKIKEVEKGQRESEKAEKSQIHAGEVDFDSPIDALQYMTTIYDNIIKKGQLKAVERKEMEKRLESIREILKLEVDERIPEERADAIRERDNEWNKYLEQCYVEKEVVADLDSTIKERDYTIGSLRKIIEEKDDCIIKNQYDISQLRDYNQYLLWGNNDLNEKNLQLHYHIENRLDTDVRYWQEKLTSDQEDLYVGKTNFDRYRDVQQSNLDKLFFEADEKLKTVEMREEKLNEQEGKLKKRDTELDKNTKIMNNTLEESIKAIEQRMEDVTESEKRLKIWIDEQNEEFDAKRKKIKDDQEKITQKLKVINKTVEELKAEEHRLQEWQKHLNNTRGFNKFSLPCPHCEKPMLFDANNQEIYQKISQAFGNYSHPECRPKSEQQKHVILRPVSSSGESVMQSGFPIICSGGEPIVVQGSGEPVVQSGCSPVYYSGTEILDKNGKKGVTVSS